MDYVKISILIKKKGFSIVASDGMVASLAFAVNQKQLYI